MKLSLTQPQVELEAWAELGNNGLACLRNRNKLWTKADLSN